MKVHKFKDRGLLGFVSPCGAIFPGMDVSNRTHLQWSKVTCLKCLKLRKSKVGQEMKNDVLLRSHIQGLEEDIASLAQERDDMKESLMMVEKALDKITLLANKIASRTCYTKFTLGQEILNVIETIKRERKA